METIFQAYAELVKDEATLYDPEESGYVGAAVPVSLDRETTGTCVITVQLKNIDGAQLRLILDVARRYELDAREEGGWLLLERHLTTADIEDEDREPEAVEA